LTSASIFLAHLFDNFQLQHIAVLIRTYISLIISATVEELSTLLTSPPSLNLTPLIHNAITQENNGSSEAKS